LAQFELHPEVERPLMRLVERPVRLFQALRQEGPPRLVGGQDHRFLAELPVFILPRLELVLELGAGVIDQFNHPLGVVLEGTVEEVLVAGGIASSILIASAREFAS